MIMNMRLVDVSHDSSTCELSTVQLTWDMRTNFTALESSRDAV